MLNKGNKVIFHLVVALIILVPLITFGAEKGLVGCDGTKEDPCDWAKFFELLGAMMRYIYVTVFSVATILFAYAGFLLMSSQGDPGKVTQAKDIFKNVIIGVSIMFLSYWAIWMLLRGLGVDTSFYQLLTG